MRRLITLLIAALIAMTCIVLSSCSPETRAAKHLEKARRHVAKARILDPSAVKTDTVYKEIKVTVKEVKTDTIFKDVGDTVTISKERLSIRYIRDTITNVVQITGECEADTIIKEVPVEVKETVYIKQSFWRTIPGIIMIVGGILFVVLALMRFVFKVV